MYKDILKVLNSATFVKFIIYKERIVFASDSVLKALGYTFNEIRRKSIEEFVPSNYAENIKKIKERRLKNERFLNTYLKLPIFRKDGAILHSLVFSDTIEYEGSPAGFIILLDITEKNFIENIICLINTLNEQSIIVESEHDFIQQIFEKANSILESNFSIITKYNYANDNFELIEPAKNKTEFFDFFVKRMTNTLLERLKKNEIVIEKTDLNNYKSCYLMPVVTNRLKYVIAVFSPFYSLNYILNIRIMKNLRDTIVTILHKLSNENNYRLLYKALENSPDWVLITDKHGKIIYVNKTVERLTKYSKEELIGNTPKVLKSGKYDKTFYDKMWKTLLAGEPFGCVILNKDKYGKYFKVEHLIIPVKTGKEITHFVALGKDLSREEKLQGEIFELKFRDILTNLYNRYGFIITVENILSAFKSDKSGSCYVLVLIDLCNFSHINSVYKEEIGDEILKDIASMLQKLEVDAVLGRMGGDEFAILKKTNKKNLEKYIKSILELFKISKFSSLGINISVNLGISIYPDDSQNLKELINQARASLKIARNRGENEVEFYNRAITSSINKKIEEKKLIEQALENEWFEVFLQPYFFTDNLRLAGFEALLRIRHPEKGILTPYHFINTLEASDYLFEVEKYIIRTVAITLKKWGKKGKKDLSISINLTGRSLKNSSVTSFFEKQVSSLENSSIVNVEVTERIFLENLEYLQNLFEKWSKYKVEISLDDFGTGYSSLSYISELPINIIKVDISFVRKMIEDKKTLAITETIILMAKKLGLKTIAEGVETETQLSYLRKFQCDIIQGFLLAKPCSIFEAEKYI